VHPFRIKLQTFSPCGSVIFDPKSLDWARVQHDFDYVWAYDVPQFSLPLSAIGKLVFEKDDIRVFQLDKSSTGTVLGKNLATAGRYQAYEREAGGQIPPKNSD